MSLNNTTGAELERAKRMLAGAAALQKDVNAAGMGAPEVIDPFAVPTATDIDALISEARARMALAPIVVVADNKLEAAQPDVVNGILAKAAELKRVAETATKSRDKLTALLAELTGEAEELTVHGATVFTVSSVTSRALNTDFIKSKFPDIEGNEDYWKSSTSKRRLYK